MKDQSKKIIEILKECDENTQKEILLECATSIGSEEWQEKIKDLWGRMESLDKK